MLIPPHPIGTQPLVDFREWFGIQRIDATLGLDPDLYKTTFAERSKVFGSHISHPDISLRLEIKQLCEVLHRGHRDKEMIGVMKARSFQVLIASGNHGRAEALAAQAIF
ncbi:hypothetical protein [Alicyclobacillus macrosporangiidus]|uniref:hypothetical protein n=1 Tax=Alicyclobacillus macrosporangiidus TaxID=392015 RepID=UPI001587E6EC|nr:hypothetical protein [Alicyclobacillus macrosporangiidus]